MLYINPAVAQPDPSRRHARPRLKSGQSLYVPASELPPVAADGTRTLDATLCEGDWRDLLASAGHWNEAQGGSTWNTGM